LSAEVTNLSIEESTSEDRPQFLVGGDNEVVGSFDVTALDGVAGGNCVTNGSGVGNGKCIASGNGVMNGSAGDCVMQTHVSVKHDSSEDNFVRRSSVRKTSGSSASNHPSKYYLIEFSELS